VAARHAYSTGLDLAMVIGAACVAAVAITIHLALRTSTAKAPARGGSVLRGRAGCDRIVNSAP
jgi:hypothetical protein